MCSCRIIIRVQARTGSYLPPIPQSVHCIYGLLETGLHILTVFSPFLCKSIYFLCNSIEIDIKHSIVQNDRRVLL